MKAAIFDTYGPPEVVRIAEVETPVPKDNEILVEVRAATVSKADHEMRSFTFPLWLRLPLMIFFGARRPRIRILGQEVSGTVAAVGAQVTGFKVGDNVFAPSERFGAHAEYIVLPADGAVAHMSDGLSFDDAACLTVFALNALHFVRKAEITPGDKVAINGAGGSIGTVAVQLAKHLGADVWAVDDSAKLETLRAIGADHVVDYRAQDFLRLGQRFDAILDVAGTALFSRSMRALGEGGRLVLANPMLFPMLRGFVSNWFRRKHVLFQFAGYRRDDLEWLRDLFDQGALKPVIDRCFPFRQIADAHRYVAAGAKNGNVVARWDEGKADSEGERR